MEGGREEDEIGRLVLGGVPWRDRDDMRRRDAVTAKPTAGSQRGKSTLRAVKVAGDKVPCPSLPLIAWLLSNSNSLY